MEKNIGGSSTDEIIDIARGIDGKFIAVGTSSSVDIDLQDCGFGSLNGWVMKFDSNGDIIWSNCYGGTDADYFIGCLPLENGNYLLVGRTDSNDGEVSGNHSSVADIWVVMIDSGGTLLWQKCYGGTNGEYPSTFNGNSCIVQTDDGGFVICGLSNSSDGDLTDHYGSEFYRDVWVFKIDSIGELQWQRNIGGSDDEISAGILNNGTGFLVVTSTLSTDFDLDGLPHYGNYDIFLAGLDSMGNITSKHTYGGQSKETGGRIIKSSLGGYLICGVSLSHDEISGIGSLLALKLNDSLELSWAQRYGSFPGGETAFTEAEDSGEYILLGYTYPVPNNDSGQVSTVWGHEDFWCIRINDNGQLLWEESFGGSSADYGFGISILSNESFIIAGETSSDDGQVDDVKGMTDGWIIKLDEPTGFPRIVTNTQNHLIVYPNPCKDFVNIKLEVFDKPEYIENLTLYTLTGQQFLGYKDLHAHHISLSMPGGFYIVSALSNIGKLYFSMITVE